MYAKKSLGQHFLKSEKALRSIRDAADPVNTDLILEIGPGQGALTDTLLAFAGKIIAVEKDNQLFAELKEKYRGEIASGQLDLINGDILDFDPEILKFYKDLTYKLVANIPYNITGAILEKFLSAAYQPERMVLLVQKEVAERIVARDKKESVLSLSVKVYGQPKLVEKVLAGSFAPPPKVDSAIISIENISKVFFQNFSEKDFFQLLHTGFKSKRKKLSSNLATIYSKTAVQEIFSKLELDSNLRAEDTRLETWQHLAQELFRDRRIR